jgi:hypothetical protein
MGTNESERENESDLERDRSDPPCRNPLNLSPRKDNPDRDAGTRTGHRGRGGRAPADPCPPRGRPTQTTDEEEESGITAMREREFGVAPLPAADRRRRHLPRRPWIRTAARGVRPGESARPGGVTSRASRHWVGGAAVEEGGPRL